MLARQCEESNVEEEIRVQCLIKKLFDGDADEFLGHRKICDSERVVI